MHLPMQETWVRSLGQEDPLEEEIATHSSILAWGIPWTEEPGSYSPWGHKESDTTKQAPQWNRHNVFPLQYIRVPIHISLRISDVECLFMCILAICCLL